ncbi:TetR/AcrR family transcriptional regulator [Zobellia galactanivorans]|uniref:TetR-type transcriptional regulator n=1 Tax=Zobellia galactanivorans (strain DSM 12802 / CCUG 47099 / CIP 106680 / NCIMB 13871 / Dsij) TaxID=63186 RepID=G0L6B0_ZOBGA|nr:TetR/AcrR family transcriptional regulator [Zobellia galactanivorans]CAZ96819.1 TetR-type transcriptional regulator [Zobellia galactanivorans]
MTKASNTRHTILEKAFDLIYRKGYQTTSIDEIIATTEVTKGAFYYHFKTKDEMGIAIINEIVKPTMQDAFIVPLQNASSPLEAIYGMTESLLFETPFLKLEYGCPASNLAQEMTPWNEAFSKALNELILEWQTTIEKAIQKEIENGAVRSDVNPKQVAYFVMSSYWGIRNFGKAYNDTDCYHAYLKELKRYLNQLK